MEILTKFLELRARNLRYALRRMLMDETEVTWLQEKKGDWFGIVLLKKGLEFNHKIINKTD